ncbi:hypothetical protein YC2023_018521 [Brassica napus]
MTSRRKPSSKSRGDRSVPGGSSSRDGNVAPKVEFSDHSIDPEYRDTYWTTRGEPKHRPPGIWHPALFRANPVEGCPSSSCPNGLDAIRGFCKVQEWVEFRLPVAGEVAESPPDGYFTCFEVYLMQCHLWFPLPEIIVQLFSRFGLGFGQIKPVGLHHIIGILVLSYEWGIPLDVDHLEALLMFKGHTATVQLGPWTNKAIIVDFVSNYHVWTQSFFFVRIDDASVEESCIPILRTICGRRGTFDLLHASFGFDDIGSYKSVSRFAETNPFPPAPDGLTTNISLLRSGDFYWGTFTPKRVVALHQRERSRNRKDKLIVVDDDEAGGGCFPETLVGDYFDGESFDLEESLGSNPPEAEGGSVEGPEFTKASRLVNGSESTVRPRYGFEGFFSGRRNPLIPATLLQ